MSPVLWGIVSWGQPGRGTTRLVVACSSDRLWAVVALTAVVYFGFAVADGRPPGHRRRGGDRRSLCSSRGGGVTRRVWTQGLWTVASTLADWCQGVVELTTAIRTRRVVRLTVAPA